MLLGEQIAGLSVLDHKPLQHACELFGCVEIPAAGATAQPLAAWESDDCRVAVIDAPHVNEWLFIFHALWMWS
jgi:hypothetical protein